MTKSILRITALLLPVQLICVKILAQFPEFIEQYYSNGIYPILSKLFRYSLGWIPFSFGDLFYFFIVVLILKWLYQNFRSFIKKPLNYLIETIAFLSIIYFIFHLFWGLNYHRLPLHKSLNIDHQYTTEELIDVTKKIVNKTNEVHLLLVQNDSTKVTSEATRNELFSKTPEGFVHLSKKFPHLKYEPTSIKKSLYSLPLTYMGFSGYFNPFTGEAQVNSKIPLTKFPVVSCHEEAHQLGFSAENETNFIGILATIHNPDHFFKYSGYLSALRYCLNELHRRAPKVFEELIQKVHYGIRLNFKENSNFWDAYENPLEPLFKKSFDTFLKANNQKSGIKSYSYVVALLVNYYKTVSL